MIDANERLRVSLRRHLIAGSALIILLFGGVGGWALTTELSGAVVAPGALKIAGNAKKVQHEAGGTIAELKVNEGQLLEAGELIARLDDTVMRADLTAAEQSLDQLFARQARLEAERDGLREVRTPAKLLQRPDADVEATMAGERRLFDERRAARTGHKARLQEQISQLRQQIRGLDLQQTAKAKEIVLIERELEGVRKLFELGMTPLHRVNNLDRNVARLDGERGQLIASIASAKGKISEIEVQLEQVEREMRTEVAKELADVRREEAQLINQEVKARDALSHVDIRAPIAGAVHRLKIHTVGGVVTPAETLMEIVPQGADLTVEALVAPQDIDQISIGQSAMLRLSAFNRNTTPEIFGSVVRISADLEIDETTGQGLYRTGITIPAAERDRLPDVALVPGMPVEAFIRTSNRTVASYFLKPLRDHSQRALRQE